MSYDRGVSPAVDAFIGFYGARGMWMCWEVWAVYGFGKLDEWLCRVQQSGKLLKFKSGFYGKRGFYQ